MEMSAVTNPDFWSGKLKLEVYLRSQQTMGETKECSG